MKNLKAISKLEKKKKREAKTIQPKNCWFLEAHPEIKSKGDEQMTKKTKTKDKMDGEWKELELDSDLFNMMKQMRHEPKEVRDEFLKTLKDGFKDAEKSIIKKAVAEGIITQKEYDKLKGKYIDDDGVCSLATYIDAVRMQKKHPEDKAIFVTMPGTLLLKDRKKFEKRFGVLIRTPAEQIEIFKKEDPKAFAEFEKQMEKDRHEESRAMDYIG